MIVIRGREDLERWLLARPRVFRMALASRAALRALPALSGASGTLTDPKKWVLEPAFRAANAVWLRARLDQAPSRWGRAISIATDRAAGDARIARAVAEEGDSRAAFAATDCVANAALAAIPTGGSEINAAAAAAHLSYAAAYCSGMNGARSGTEAYEAVQFDAEQLEERLTTGELTRRPLWHNAMPEWARENWNELRADLLSREEGWEVWTDWYEARLRGDPVNDMLEAERLECVDRVSSYSSLSQAHAEIAKVVAKYTVATPYASLPETKDLPAQAPTGVRFRQTIDDKIDVADSAPHADVAMRRRQVLAGCAAELASECESGNNLLKPHAVPLRQLQRALDDAHEDLVILRHRIGRVIAINDVNHLRLRREEYNRDAPLLPDGFAVRINSFSGDLASFVRSDADLSAIDRLRSENFPGIEGNADLAGSILEASKAIPELLTPRALQRIEELQRATTPPMDTLEPPSMEARDALGATGRNLVTSVADTLISALEPIRSSLERIASAQERSTDVQVAEAAKPDLILSNKIKEKFVDLGFDAARASILGGGALLLVTQASNIFAMVAQNAALSPIGRFVQFILQLFT